MKAIALLFFLGCSIALSAQPVNRDTVPPNPYALTEKQKNLVYSAGILMEEGSNRMMVGMIITLAASLGGVILAQDTPLLAGGIMLGGGIIGLVFTFDGLGKMNTAGGQLRQFPYD